MLNFNRMRGRSLGNTANMVYLDFAKAFHTVGYGFLFAKPESFGLCEKVVLWIRSYLTGITYRVQVAGALSEEKGIPQGSVIGPLLLLSRVSPMW